MTTHVRRLVPAALLGLGLALLGACAQSTESAPSGEGTSGTPAPAVEKDPRADLAAELVPGSCWGAQQLPAALGAEEFDAWVDEHARGDALLGDAMRDDAAFTERVECAEPHALELYNVVELSPRLQKQVEEYADLLDQDSALYRRVRDQVNDRCLAPSPYGKAQRRAGGLPVQLGPALDVDAGLRLAWDPFPPDLWEQGETKFVCTFEQEEPGTLMFADLTTSRTPVSARVCLNVPRKYVPCSGRHQAEDIAEMVLNTAIERGDVKGDKAVRKGPDGRYVALSDAEYAKLDKVCRTFLRSVSKPPEGVEARAYPGAVSQWPTRSGAYVASCFALRPVSEEPPPIRGTVFNKR